MSLRENALLHFVKCLATVEAEGTESDSALLARFLAHNDQAAFAALVRRHSLMVLGVCRRILHHEQDAEDAFQATFLVLTRKAEKLLDRPSLGPWLYEVAYRTALKARVGKE